MKRALAILMALSVALSLALPASAATTATDVAQMQNAISGLRVIAVMLAAIFLLVLILKISAAIKRKKGVSFVVLILAAVALVATLVLPLAVLPVSSVLAVPRVVLGRLAEEYPQEQAEQVLPVAPQ